MATDTNKAIIWDNGTEADGKPVHLITLRAAELREGDEVVMTCALDITPGRVFATAPVGRVDLEAGEVHLADGPTYIDQVSPDREFYVVAAPSPQPTAGTWSAAARRAERVTNEELDRLLAEDANPKVYEYRRRAKIAMGAYGIYLHGKLSMLAFEYCDTKGFSQFCVAYLDRYVRRSSATIYHEYVPTIFHFEDRSGRNGPGRYVFAGREGRRI